jgi:hypothetical protein
MYDLEMAYVNQRVLSIISWLGNTELQNQEAREVRDGTAPPTLAHLLQYVYARLYILKGSIWSDRAESEKVRVELISSQRTPSFVIYKTCSRSSHPDSLPVTFEPIPVAIPIRKVPVANILSSPSHPELCSYVQCLTTTPVCFEVDHNYRHQRVWSQFTIIEHKSIDRPPLYHELPPSRMRQAVPCSQLQRRKSVTALYSQQQLQVVSTCKQTVARAILSWKVPNTGN